MVKPFYIPNGPANLSGFGLNFEEIAEYYVEILNSSDEVIATSPMNQVCGCEDDEDTIRIHFINKLGGIDAINFKIIAKDHESKSDTWERSTSYPLDKTEHGENKFNIKSNKAWHAETIDYPEEDMEWFDEIYDSPQAWIEWPGGEDQPAGFLPIVITDTKTPDQKEADRYTYKKEIEFRMSNEQFNIRN
jgi:hypothetical protein